MNRKLRWGVAGGAVAALAAAVTISAWPAAATADLGWKFQPTLDAPWANYGPGHGRNSDAVATGLCRWAPFTLPGAYAATTDIDVITGDQINNSGSSNFGCTTPQNETAIAVDPGNPNHLVAGSNDYRLCCDFTGLNDGTGWAYTSFDGGATWANVLPPGLTAQTGGQGQFAHVDAAGDPAVAIGPDGTAYYANIVFSRISANSGIAVSVSSDGGLNWDPPNMVSWSGSFNYFNDKELIAVSPNGDVVVTWTEFNLGPQGNGYRESPIVMAISKDKGKTWNNQGAPVSDAAHPFDQGSYPAFGPDGTLYVAYEASDPATNYATDVMMVARSTDSGKTFTNTPIGRVYDDLDCYPIFNGRQTLTGEHFRLNSYPSFSVDPTNGNLAVVWADNQGAGNCGTGGSSFVGTTSAQVKLVSGAWGSLSAPTTITTGAGDKVFPAVGANNGKIAISYYTRDYTATHNAAVCNIATGIGGVSTPPVVTASSVCLDYATRDSSDGYASETRLTSEGSNPYIEFADGAFIGDYTQLAFGSDGVAHASWTDFRGRPGTNSPNQDVYVANFTP